MKSVVTPYGDKDRSKKEQVAEMFDNIAPRYDFLNTMLSMGIHSGWRKKAVSLLADIQPRTILDVATGTGDFTFEAMRLHPDKVIGVDISEGMMAVGREKVKKKGLESSISLQFGDSEALPFPDGAFDAVTVGFGARNFGDLLKGLQEIHRVMRIGGKAVILEPAAPTVFPLKQLFNFYFRFILPVLGRMISKDKAAYTYLPESVKAFPNGRDFVAICKQAGFTKAEYRPLTLGICSLYLLEK